MIKTIVGALAIISCLISFRANAENQRTYLYPPKGYVAVCKTGNKTTVEPYEIHEARVTRGLTPFVPTFSSSEKALEEVAARVRPYSNELARHITEKLPRVMGKAKFLESTDIMPDMDETMPPPLTQGCEVKKLFRFQPAQLPYDFLFDASLWNAMSEVGRAAALMNIGSSLDCEKYYCEESTHEGYAQIRKLVALAVSSKLTQMSGREWFSELKAIKIDSVVYRGISVKIDGAQFNDKTGAIEKATATNLYPSRIWTRPIYLNGPVEFYPNESVHRFYVSPSLWAYAGDGRYDPYWESSDAKVDIRGGTISLSINQGVEVSESLKILRAAFEPGAPILTDKYLLFSDGTSYSFHPSGYIQNASGLGKVELNGRIVSVHSILSFDPNGNILSGYINGRVKIHDGRNEYELDRKEFTAYPNGRIKSAFLAADASLQDCTGTMRQFKAGSEIHFNEAGIPCGSAQ